MKDRTRDPERDKKNSYQRDCRNTYGESPHGARKSIPRNKARGHRKTRLVAKRALHRIEDQSPEAQDLMESDCRQDIGRFGTWKKLSDLPLGVKVADHKLIRDRKDGKIDHEEYHEMVGKPYDDYYLYRRVK